MEIITLKDAQKLASPQPFALLVSADATGKQNIMVLSWWTYASSNPPYLVVCLGANSYSRQLIGDEKEFTLCIVDQALQDAAFACGTCSGRTINKPAKFNIALSGSTHVRPMYVRDSYIVLECRVTEETTAGNHSLFIAEVLAVHADTTKTPLFAFDGYSRLGTLA